MYVRESELLLGVITLFTKFLSGQLNDDDVFKVIVLTFRYAKMRPWKVGAAGEAVTAMTHGPKKRVVLRRGQPGGGWHGWPVDRRRRRWADGQAG